MLIELINVQSIKSALYDVPEKGITQIIGENSNGKSILAKAMAFVANLLITDESERVSLINDDSSEAYIIMKRNGMQLKVTVSEHRENCYFELTRSDGSIIKRTIREGGLDKLNEEFGWISFKNNFCLQIYETFGYMPFVSKNYSLDYDIVDRVITDKVASDFVESYEKITYPSFREYVKNLNSKINNMQSIIDGITIYDTEKYEDMLFKLKFYKVNVSELFIYNPEKIKINKALNYIPMDIYTPTRLPIYTYIESFGIPISFIEDISNLNKVIQGVCPTCGLRFKDVLKHTC